MSKLLTLCLLSLLFAFSSSQQDSQQSSPSYDLEKYEKNGVQYLIWTPQDGNYQWQVEDQDMDFFYAMDSPNQQDASLVDRSFLSYSGDQASSDGAQAHETAQKVSAGNLIDAFRSGDSDQIIYNAGDFAGQLVSANKFTGAFVAGAGVTYVAHQLGGVGGVIDEHSPIDAVKSGDWQELLNQAGGIATGQLVSTTITGAILNAGAMPVASIILGPAGPVVAILCGELAKDYVSDAITDDPAGAFGKAWGFVVDTGRTVADAASSGADIFVDAAVTVGNFVADSATTVVDVTTDVVNGAINTASEAGDVIVDALDSVLSWKKP